MSPRSDTCYKGRGAWMRPEHQDEAPPKTAPQAKYEASPNQVMREAP